MDVYQQTKQLFTEAHNLLLCLPHNSTPDNITAALVLKLFLEASNKTVEVVSSNISSNHQLKFIKNIGSIKSFLPPLKQLVISISTKNTPLQEFTYHTDEDQEALNIYLEPKRGEFDPKDVSIKNIDYKFDTIINIGVTNFDSLGQIFETAPDFFYNTPVINIDHQTNNERYGQINLVSLTSVANSEIVYDLLLGLDQKDLLDKNMATILLTGILSETSGLRSSTLTPQVLEKISQLLTYGVNVAEINKNLFHSKSLDSIKLWGRVLARLKEDTGLGLVWSLTPKEDFEKTNTTPTDLPQIINELISTYTEARLVLLLWQTNVAVEGVLQTTHQHNALDLTNSFSSHGSSSCAQFTIVDRGLRSAEQLVINHLKQQLNKNNT